VDPDFSAINYASPPAADATALGFSPAIECILPITRNAGKFDEISILRFTSGDSSGGASTASLALTRTLQLNNVDGNCPGAPSVSGQDQTWAQLPSAEQCQATGQELLGWSTSAAFPRDVALEQFQKDWGAIDGEFDGQRMIFVPAGGFTFLSNDNRLYPIWR